MEVLTVIPEEVFNKIPIELINQFKSVMFQEVNEYETNKDDPLYIELYKTFKKHRDKKNEYLFNKRHKK